MVKKKILIYSTVLLIIGLYMVFQSSQIWANYLHNDRFFYLKRQALFALIGFVCFIVSMKINLHKIRKYSFLILLLGLVTLLLVLFLGVNVNGSTSWFKIGSFMFQPSEIFKIIIVFYMADKLDKYYLETNKFYKTILILLIPLVIGFALIMLQPDLGSAIVILGGVIMMCILSKNSFYNYLFIGILGIICFTILIISSPYRIERIFAFLNPYNDPLGSGFQLIQSLYAIGPGGIIGKGINSSFQKHYYLPEPQTDFIFAIYAEEYGLIGSIILLFLYAMLFKNILKLIRESKNMFNAFLRIGLASMIIIQVCINLFVVVGLIPVTGITLPFLSYGGSSLIVVLVSIGLIVNEKGENDENIIIR